MSQLPRDLVGEILCRVPAKSLARLRAVCKQWNAIWEDKFFLKTYLSRARPQFMVQTFSQTCSIEIKLDEDHVYSIEERDITLEFPFKTYSKIGYCDSSIGYCDGFVLTGMNKKGFAVWNPWVRQSRFIENHEFCFCGIGYDNSSPETGYKIFGSKSFFRRSRESHNKVAIYDCKSDTWKFISDTGEEPRGILEDSCVSMHGNLYFLAFYTKTYKSSIITFDFSKDIFKTICALPSIGGPVDTQALAVFRGDRLSLLMQSKLTEKVEILVTKQKIDGNGEGLVWINFMTVSIPNLPSLQPNIFCSQPSYFLDTDSTDDKTLFVCTCDESERLCIYIIKGDMFKKISIDSMTVDPSPYLSTSSASYIPSFVSIP